MLKSNTTVVTVGPHHRLCTIFINKTRHPRHCPNYSKLTLHAAIKLLVQLLVHLERVHPVTQSGDYPRLGVRYSITLLISTHKCLLLHPSRVCGGGPSVEAGVGREENIIMPHRD